MVLLAYLLRDWMYMQLSFAVFSTLLILFYFLVTKNVQQAVSQIMTESGR